MKGKNIHRILLVLVIILVILNQFFLPRGSNRKAKCEKILESKYGKDFTVDSIYGGDYSGVYYGKAHADDRPDLVFSFSNNSNIKSDDSFSDEYQERLKSEVYQKEFDEILGKYDKDYYVYTDVIFKDEKDVLFYTLYFSSEWLDYSDDELWEIASGIVNRYGNCYILFVTSDDLQRIKDEYLKSDELSSDLTTYLKLEYSLGGDYESDKNATVIFTKDNKEQAIEELKEIRNHELFRK